MGILWKRSIALLNQGVIVFLLTTSSPYQAFRLNILRIGANERR